MNPDPVEDTRVASVLFPAVQPVIHTVSLQLRWGRWPASSDVVESTRETGEYIPASRLLFTVTVTISKL